MLKNIFLSLEKILGNLEGNKIEETVSSLNWILSDLLFFFQ